MTDDEGLGLGLQPHVDLFAATVVRFRTRAGWQQITPSDQRSGERLEGGLCHVISAVHSHQAIGDGSNFLRNTSIPESFNARRHIDLWTELSARGTWAGDAVGVAPDLTHGEISVAVGGLTRDEAIEVGRRFRQVAVFEIDDDCVRVVGCLADGVLSERPYHLRVLGDVRPCPMFGGVNAAGARMCSPPVVKAAGQARELRAWKERWWEAYGLLGCDLCKGSAW